jgi:hypothetical protein
LTMLAMLEWISAKGTRPHENRRNRISVVFSFATTAEFTKV